MGKRDITVDWQADYASKLMSAEQAAAAFESGDHVWIPPGHASPEILTALAARRDQLRGVEVRGIVIPDVGWYDESFMDAFHIAPQFGTPRSDREARNSCRAPRTAPCVFGASKDPIEGRAERGVESRACGRPPHATTCPI